jgi:hypothetical protein
MSYSHPPKVVEISGQTQLNLEDLDAMEVMPRCERTQANVDLHLVAFTDPDTGVFTASILGPEYRHLVRRTTTLSIPIGMLSIGAIRSLETQKKIPPGSEAVMKLKAWLRFGVNSSWKEIMESKRICQEPLDLDDAAGLGLR